MKTSDVRSDRNASPKSCGTGLGQHRHALAADRRHEAEQRQLEPPRDVFRRLDRVVEILDPERQAERHREAGQHRRDPVLAAGWARSALSGTSARSITWTLFARLLATTDSSFCCVEQRLVDLPVAVRLALQDVVVAALLVEIDRRRPSPPRAAREAALLGQLRRCTRSGPFSMTFVRSATSDRRRGLDLPRRRRSSSGHSGRNSGSTSVACSA